jgi:hypothetical protein
MPCITKRSEEAEKLAYGLVLDILNLGLNETLELNLKDEAIKLKRVG